MLRHTKRRHVPCAHFMIQQWYREHFRDSGVDDDLARWGVDYDTYRDEYARAFSEIIPLEPELRVFESAVGMNGMISEL